MWSQDLRPITSNSLLQCTSTIELLLFLYNYLKTCFIQFSGEAKPQKYLNFNFFTINYKNLERGECLPCPLPKLATKYVVTDGYVDIKCTQLSWLCVLIKSPLSKFKSCGFSLLSSRAHFYFRTEHSNSWDRT